MSNIEDDDQEHPAPSRRWIWISLALALVLIGTGAYIVDRWMAPIRDAEKMQDLVKAMGDRFTAVDRDFAARMEAQQRESPLGSFGPEQAIDAGARSNTRAWAEAGIALIDETLARRALIPNETIARIEASRANDKAKSAMVKGIRDAVAKQVPMSVRIMTAMRAYLAKIGEMAAYLDLNAQAIQLREGQLEFDDSAAGEHYNNLEHELAVLEQQLKVLQRGARK
jgi:hypothetical protein